MMGTYNNILLAVDLHPSYDEYTIKKAVDFAKERNAKLTLLHCIEGIHAYGAVQGYQLIMEVEQQIEQEAKKALADLGKTYGIAPENQMLVQGPPQKVVIEKAKAMKADLIIVGGHGRHGISLLFGSTADGIMHHAQCDVLAIRAKS
ncbi:MAG: universal stress protein [Proteobacteria bacterium]|nr:universal stress protein [Pseudomonadota bacterium]